ncbi:hypothetical protein [Pseudomonas sp. Marseille-P9655]|uniref:hypothetical protein n=1 Tax=Pseudomonas sp. Marseille-P9655 TaxID=2866591 RepID=UPI001CE42626|nr:hypothetical protein [Pseudomonas sp. Marseille-P9655]
MSLPRTTDYPCHSSSPRQTDSVEFHWDQSDNVFLKATEDGQHASIVLDRAQVQSLRNQLTSWLGGGLAQPSPQPHPEPIAWMVGTAFWWTKEEAERDAAATGLPIVGLGPMSGITPAEQRQGEPVAWMDPRSPQMHATISNEVKQHNVKFGGAPASEVNGYTIPLYTNAGPGEVERCEARLHEVAILCASVEQERDALRAQLAECEAMAAMIAEREWAEHAGTGPVSSKVEAAFTKLHNDVHEAGEMLAERDALLHRMKTLFRTDDPFDLYDAVCDALAGKS